MQAKLSIKNLVIVGFFDIVIFDKYFFIKNKIFTEEEILPVSKFDTNSSQVSTENIDIFINANQILITFKKLEVADNTQLKEIAVLIIREGKLSKINAFGFNFHYIFDNVGSLELLSKQMFYNNKVPLFSKFFTSDDSVFGIYASTNFKNGRLKLEGRPARLLDASQQPKDIIVFIFNYHFDNTNKSNVEVITAISEFDEYESHSQQVISIYSQ